MDFGEVAVLLAGRMVTCYLFSLRLSYSGRAIHMVSTSGGQEAFLEGHVHAFSVLGGVPFRHIRYDNLKCAVATVLGLTRARTEVPKWTAFRSHYCSDPRVVVHLESGEDVVMVRGTAQDLGAPAGVPEVMAALSAKYTADGDQQYLPDADPDFDVVYAIRPQSAMMWHLADYEASQRRWTC